MQNHKKQGRKMRIKLGQHRSEEVRLEAGVPQEVLAFHVITYYIDTPDTPRTEGTKLGIFVDDTVEESGLQLGNYNTVLTTYKNGSLKYDKCVKRPKLF